MADIQQANGYAEPGFPNRGVRDVMQQRKERPGQHRAGTDVHATVNASTLEGLFSLGLPNRHSWTRA